MKLKTSLALFRCSRCRKSYSNPLGHVCVSNRTTPRKTRLAVRATVTRTCPKCRKPANNPLTHVCIIRTDWKRRKAAAGKRAKAARRKAPPRHMYETCQDSECMRLTCRAWRGGKKEGHEEGYEEGYPAGFAAGLAAAARSQ